MKDNRRGWIGSRGLVVKSPILTFKKKKDNNNILGLILSGGLGNYRGPGAFIFHMDIELVAHIYHEI